MKTIFKISVVVGVFVTFVLGYRTYVELSRVEDLHHQILILKEEIRVLKENR